MPRRSSFALSPSKRRSFIPPVAVDTPVGGNHINYSELTPSSDKVFLDVPENNDEKEKKERQLNRLQQQIQSRQFSSPTQTPSDRRKSLNAVAGLSNQQLSEHYAKCIQLNAENKISIKNAFNLQLIDYMAEMLRRKDSDMNNFQVASCTLDASTKIYAYRVDSVHTDTLKMAGGLGRTHDKEKRGDDEAVADDGDPKNTAKKKQKTRKKAVIEANIKNLDINQFDLEFDVDPLFKKMTSQFDEGSSGRGQFLNTLQLMDDSCQMMLDSEAVVVYNSELLPSSKERIPITKPSDLNRLICPTFAQFEFTKWKVGDEDSFCESSRLHNGKEDDHRFDVDAVPEPIEEDPYDADDGFGMDTAEDDGVDNGTVVTVGQGGCHKAPPLMEAVHLKDHLAMKPSEYSYFDLNRISAWAGPQHWRLKPLSKVKTAASGEEVKRRKKAYLTLEYDKEPDDIEKLFARTKKAIELSHQTLKLWNLTKTTLPRDLHYDARNFTKLHGRPAIIIRRQSKAASVDDSVSNYNYDNPNDKDNYCADVDDTASNYGDQTVGGYDMTEIFSQTVLGSQPLNGDNDKFGTGDLFDNLVAAPNKVAKINIGYARQAKRIDMKKLKSTMWSMLADKSVNKENEQGLENQAGSASSEINKMDPGHTLDFGRLYKTLPSKLSTKMSESLSVSLAFIALLHLANEHNLKLSSKGDLQDFSVSQG